MTPYATVRILIETGKITTLPQVLEHIPVATFAKDLDMQTDQFEQLLTQPGKFNMGLMHKISEVFEVDGALIMNMLATQFEKYIKNHKE